MASSEPEEINSQWNFIFRLILNGIKPDFSLDFIHWDAESCKVRMNNEPPWMDVILTEDGKDWNSLILQLFNHLSSEKCHNFVYAENVA